MIPNDDGLRAEVLAGSVAAIRERMRGSLERARDLRREIEVGAIYTPAPPPLPWEDDPAG